MMQKILDAVKAVLASRKNWHIDYGMLKAALTQMIFIYGLSHGWAPDKAQDLVRDSGIFLSLCLALGGALNAILTAAEDMARKWGILTPLPAEVPVIAVSTISSTNERAVS